MNRTNWLDVAAKCFSHSNAKELHVNEMAEIALKYGVIKDQDKEIVANKLASSLSSNVKVKNSLFRKVKNKSGGLRKGIYRQKPEPIIKLQRNESPVVDTGYTGKAGEHAVLSELLFRGYNASIMVVDEGIDVVATKDNKYFHLQVKTANGDDSKPYYVTIRKESFQNGFNTFYIIVMRRALKQRFVTDYLILPSIEIRDFIKSGALKDGATINLKLSVKNERFFLNGERDVTYRINDFDNIC